MSEGADFNFAMFAVFVAIVLAIALQNWWLRRRAEGKPLLPARLRRMLESRRS